MISWSAGGASRMNRAWAVHLVKSASGTRDIPIQGGMSVTMYRRG